MPARVHVRRGAETMSGFSRPKESCLGSALRVRLYPRLVRLSLILHVVCRARRHAYCHIASAAPWVRHRYTGGARRRHRSAACGAPQSRTAARPGPGTRRSGRRDDDTGGSLALPTHTTSSSGCRHCIRSPGFRCDAICTKGRRSVLNRHQPPGTLDVPSASFIKAHGGSVSAGTISRRPR